MPTVIKHKIGSGAPLASDLVEGELGLDTVNGRAYTENSVGSIVELGVNPAGEIQANAGIALPDSQKATFGASDDLQIYHDGSNSFIKDSGTGILFIQGSGGVRVLGTDTSEALARFNENSSVQLYYDSSEKFATTSTGIDVTGTVTADGLTVDGNATFSKAGGTTFVLENSTSAPYAGTELQGAIVFKNYDTSGDGDHIGARIDSYITDTVGSANLQFSTGRSDSNLAKRLEINEDGDISFYEDTGTTAKFFWDASAESLGIGTSSPSSSTNLTAQAAASSSLGGILMRDEAGANAGYIFVGGSAHSVPAYRGDLNLYSTNTLNFFTGGSTTQRAIIDSSGNVGIGTSSPSQALDIVSTGTTPLELTGATACQINLNDGTQSANWGLGVGGVGQTAIASPSTYPFLVYTNSVERMRIDSSGNLLVGTTSESTWTTTAGFRTRQSGSTTITRSGANVAYFNRLTSDGSIAEFLKDGTTVGSIGTYSGQAYFAGPDSGIRNGYYAIQPTGNTGISTNGLTDLGGSSSRFKDLYLSGYSNLKGVLASGDVGAGTANIVATPSYLTGRYFNAFQGKPSDGGNGGLFMGAISTDTADLSSGAHYNSAGYYYPWGTTASKISLNAGNVLFYTNTGLTAGTTYLPTERMRIDSSGNLLVNKSSYVNAGHGVIIGGNATNAVGFKWTRTSGTGTEYSAAFYDNAGSGIGNISHTTTSTAYNTSSDYRLKENIVPMDNASSRVLALKPCRFNFIADPDKTVDGFLAHEAQEVVPEAVTGTKDAMRTEEYEVSPAVPAEYDEEGNVITEAVPAVMGTREVPDYQGIDQSKLVPLLTKALQEALTEIESLKARLDAGGL